MVLGLVVLLSACGFRLRGSQEAFDLDLGPLKVVGAGIESDLPDRLAEALARSGARPATAGEGSSTLNLLKERWEDRPLTVDSNVEVREFVTVYTVEFELTGMDGKTRVPKQEVRLEREYTFDVTAAGGTPAERQLIREELARDMVGAIVRQLSAALRATE